MATNNEFDVLMFLHKATNLQLITAPIARKLATMVFRNHFGDSELKRRLPLRVVDDGDRWTITAPFTPKPEDIDPDPNVAIPGEFKMSIMKFDGQIRGFQKKWNFHPIEIKPHGNDN